jgi:hypothetical protein
MNYRNCKYFSEEIRGGNSLYSVCGLNGKHCGAYSHRENYPYRCLGYEPTFKAIMEEAIIVNEVKYLTNKILDKQN